MTLTEFWTMVYTAVKTSPIFQGAVSTGVALVIIGGVIAILAWTFFLLGQFFKDHEGIRKAYKFLIYLLTMVSVLVLLLGGVLGLFLPIIPGVFLLLLAFLLLRRYYKNRWMDNKIKYFQWKLRLKREVKRRVRQSKIGKALRRHKRHKKR